MATAYTAGQLVRQKVTPIEGTIKRFAFDPSTGVVSYIVGWSDADGDHERSFTADELEQGTAASE